jgi:hypothetical protein
MSRGWLLNDVRPRILLLLENNAQPAGIASHPSRCAFRCGAAKVNDLNLIVEIIGIWTIVRRSGCMGHLHPGSDDITTNCRGRQNFDKVHGQFQRTMMLQTWLNVAVCSPQPTTAWRSFARFHESTNARRA